MLDGAAVSGWGRNISMGQENHWVSSYGDGWNRKRLCGGYVITGVIGGLGKNKDKCTFSD